ncbi:MAG: hypothetical protein Q7V57_05785 [Actinomycetota bacterium]|nr:hypothetical protein [Actinomycetota bacterium]
MAARTVRDELVAMIDRALGDDPRQALLAARHLVEETDWLMQRAVALARRDGFDWGRIGRNLGLTRQGARQKFPAAPPLPPPHQVRRNRAERQFREGELLAQRYRAGTLARPDDDDPIAW